MTYPRLKKQIEEMEREKEEIVKNHTESMQNFMADADAD
jgi:hypothetical protein